jgi:4-amino-4-deoxy-L-arabinose transferase-like glycosyltransferase
MSKGAKAAGVVTAEAKNASGVKMAAGAGFKVSRRAIIISILMLYLGLSIGRAVTDSPGCDEGWFASPAFNLANNGHFGTTVIEERNLSMTKAINTYTYWIMPMSPLAQAAVYKVFGFSLFSMRGLSVLFGLIALVAWLSIMDSLAGDKKVALVALAIIAVDFAFIRSASTGRMDMMSAALNFAAMAAYLRLRGRNLNLALAVSHSLVVASGLTHPNGFLGFAALTFLIFYFDRERLRPGHALAALAPYAIGALAYGLYVMHDPRLFITQFSNNGGGRLWGITDPLAAIKMEIAERYIGLSGGGPAYLKVGLVVAYVIGVAGALSVREIRTHRGYRALLIIAAIIFSYFTLIEGTKLYFYTVHIAPFFAALFAATVCRFWETRPRLRWAIAAGVCAIALINIAGSAYVIRRDSYHKNYLPAVSFLNRTAPPDSSVVGTSELSFDLARYDRLLDDKWVGYHTGRRPDFVVEDSRYRQELEAVRTREPEIYEYVTRLLDEQYRVVYDQASYKIYARLTPEK